MTPLLETISNPSGWDSLENYMGETEFGSLHTLLTRKRDADTLTESNWTCALEMLGGESESVQIHRFGHWACGWWEVLAVAKGTPAFAIAEDIEKQLDGYPVLNEEHWSDAEQTEAGRVWSDCYNQSERAEYIRENPTQFDFCGLDDAKANLRGEYFSGYASELLA